MVKRMLVTTDGSPSSFLALPLASELARAMHSEVVLLYVVQPDVVQPSQLESEREHTSPGAEDLGLRELRAAGQRALAEAVNLLGLEGVTELLLEARNFDVATTITQTAEEHGTDLIVMAPHGSSGLGHVTPGRIAERVLSRASVPVLLVKQSRQEIGAGGVQT